MKNILNPFTNKYTPIRHIRRRSAFFAGVKKVFIYRIKEGKIIWGSPRDFQKFFSSPNYLQLDTMKHAIIHPGIVLSVDKVE